MALLLDPTDKTPVPVVHDFVSLVAAVESATASKAVALAALDADVPNLPEIIATVAAAKAKYEALLSFERATSAGLAALREEADDLQRAAAEETRLALQSGIPASGASAQRLAALAKFLPLESAARREGFSKLEDAARFYLGQCDRAAAERAALKHDRMRSQIDEAHRILLLAAEIDSRANLVAGIRPSLENAFIEAGFLTTAPVRGDDAWPTSIARNTP